MDGSENTFEELYGEDDAFGTRQGEEVKMSSKTPYDFQEGAPTDYYRPFDDYDNENQRLQKDIEDSKIVS